MFLLLAGLFVAGAPVPASPSPAAGELRATFIGNMGFHITDGRVAILVDFPYESRAFGYMEWSKTLVPSGPAQLCLVSHGHLDYFTPRLAGEFCGAVLGPKDVVSASGVKAVELKDETRWEGIRIRPLATRHGTMEHFSFLVEWGGRRLYFTGDTDDTQALLAARGVDVAFVSPWLLAAVAAQGSRIDARQVVVYHHRDDEAVPEVQGRLVPRQGDVLVIDSGPTAVRVVPGAVQPGGIEPENPFGTRLKAAIANVQTPAGRTYYEGAFQKQFYAAYPARVSECIPQALHSEPSAFNMVLKLGADGRIEEALVRPETKLAGCFRSLVMKDVFPAPPAGGFSIPVSMTVTLEPRTEPTRR